ncbi:MAG: NAD-dependent epimerase/dehydratase family protein [Planctomycetota bacterium]|jgi:UDP-glucose 4-epimerase
MAADLGATYRGRGVCVTGGAGFIGSHLVTALVDLGADVSVIDDLSSGCEANLARVHDRIRFVRGSILDPVAIEQAVRDCAIVFHEAALAAVPRSVEEPILFFEVDAAGTMQVLEAARAAGAERVVYAASSSSYGECETLPKIETMAPEPVSPYAAAKLAGEALVTAWAHSYPLDGVSLRYFNIFGPRQQHDSPYAAVLPRFADAMLDGRPVTIFGDGRQTRDFTHIDNAVRANLLAGARSEPLRGAIINVACGTRYSVLHLAETMAAQLGVELQIDHQPPRPGDVMHSEADISLAHRLLGYEPTVSFEDGLQRTLEHYRQAHAAAGAS